MTRGSICQWNIRGYRANYHYLRTLISDSQAVILCLQETMMPMPIPNPPRGFAMYNKRGPQDDGPVNHGGVCTLVKHTIGHTNLDINTDLQAVAIRCQLDKYYTICNIYLPPNTPVTLDQMLNLLSQLPEPYILVGDFNARHPLWGDVITNEKGKLVENLLGAAPCSIINDGNPTHLHSQTDSLTCIDLSIVSPEIVPELQWSVCNSLYNSDHYPIIIEIPDTSYNLCPPKYIYEKADWNRFKIEAECERNINSFENIDEAVEYFNEKVINSADIAIPKTKGTIHTKRVPWWNPELRDAIREKKRANRLYHRTLLQCDKIAFNRARAIVRNMIHNARKESWKKYVSSISERTPLNKVWQKVNKISGRYNTRHTPILVNDQGDTISDPLAVANEFGSSLSDISRGPQNADFVRVKKRAESRAIRFPEDDGSDYNQPFTMTELIEALRHCGDTASGDDKISYQLIKNLPDKSIEFLLSIYNKLWSEFSFPKSWRQAIVLPFPKKGKCYQNVINYRPITLTSCVCKLQERMVNVRLVHTLENDKFFSQTQYGFRKGRCSLDAVACFDTFVKVAFARREHVAAIFFDIQKAYDTTWRYNILRTLCEIPLTGHLPRYIANFMTNRIMKIRIGNTLSDEYVQHEGVPQGSVLSCTLFAIAINKLPDCMPQYVENTLYVDDFTIFTKSNSLPAAERRLQLAVNRAQQWAQSNGFQFSPTKTVTMHFTKVRGVFPKMQINLGPASVPQVNSTKLLGMTLDPKLTWIPHLKDLKARCIKALDILKCLSRKSWGADRSRLLHIYRAQIRAKLDYGCTIYASATKTSLKMIDTVHHQGIRLSTGAFRTSPVDSLYAESGEPSLVYRREKLTLQMYTKLMGMPGTPAHNMVCNSEYDHYFEINQRRHNNMGFRARKLLVSMAIPAPNVTKTLSYDVCPYSLSLEPACPSISKTKKKENHPTALRAMFYEHAQQHRDSIEVYTDGSKSNDGASFAAVMPDKIIARRLPDAASIYTAELKAILVAVAYMVRYRRPVYTIYTDSRSAIQDISNPFSAHPMTKQIHMWLNLLKSRGKRVVFCWVPSHVDVVGNETADRAAREKITPTEINIDYPLPYKDYFPYFQSHLKKKWNDEWRNIRSNKLRVVKPTVQKWRTSYHQNRLIEVLMARIRIGHTRLTHGHLLCGGEAPLCEECIVPLTIVHIFVECPELIEQRRTCFGAGDPDVIVDLTHILRDEEEAVERVMRFLNLIEMTHSL